MFLAGCQSTCFTSWLCMLNTALHSKSSSSLTSHTHTVRSLEHEAKNCPSSDHAVHLTSFSWPSKLPTISNVSCWCFFQRVMVVSKLALARRFPHGDQLTQRTVRVCPPVRVSTHFHSRAPFSVGLFAQILIVLSPLEEASRLPVGFQETHLF